MIFILVTRPRGPSQPLSPPVTLDFVVVSPVPRPTTLSTTADSSSYYLDPAKETIERLQTVRFETSLCSVPSLRRDYGGGAPSLRSSLLLPRYPLEV